MIKFKKEKLLKAKRITGFTFTETEFMIGYRENIYAVKYTFKSGNKEIFMSDNLRDELEVWSVREARVTLNEWKVSERELKVIGQEIIDILKEDWEVCISCGQKIYPGMDTVETYEWYDNEKRTLNESSYIGISHEDCVEIAAFEGDE